MNMDLYKMRFKSSRGIRTELIAANSSDEAGAVAVAWCTSQEDQVIRLLSVEPAIIAGPSILKPATTKTGASEKR
jgi:hypothetical protein